MVFAYDTEAMLAFMTALINTEPGASRSDEDELASVEELERLLDEHDYSGRRDHDASELDAIRALREEFRDYWRLDRDQVAQRVNTVLRDERGVPEGADGAGAHLPDQRVVVHHEDDAGPRHRRVPRGRHLLGGAHVGQRQEHGHRGAPRRGGRDQGQPGEPHV